MDSLLSRPRRLRGGLILPALPLPPVDRGIQPLPLPPLIDVPMLQHDGSSAAVCVEAGQAVTAGMRIGRAETSDALDVHAPLTGRVAAILRADTARHTDVPAVRIEPNTQHRVPPYRPVQLDDGLAAPSMDDFIRAAELGGLTDFQPRPKVLAEQLRRAARGGVDHVIVNTLPGEPTLTAGGLVMLDHVELIVRMTAWLAAGIGSARGCIAVDQADAGWTNKLRNAAQGTPVRVVPLVNKYPQGSPVLLGASIVDRETPPGGSPLDVGVLALEAEALIAIAAALDVPGHRSVPMTHRVIAVSGSGVCRPGHLFVPVGTRLRDILGCVCTTRTVRRVVEGGPLTGRAVANLDVVVTKQTPGLLVLDRASDRTAAPGPCVRCGWCQEDCPLGLDPRRLLDLAEREELDKSRRYHPQACIECGLCSYICPAELPLAEGAGTLKAIA